MANSATISKMGAVREALTEPDSWFLKPKTCQGIKNQNSGARNQDLIFRECFAAVSLRHIDHADGMFHRYPAIVLHVDADAGHNHVYARIRRWLVGFTPEHAYQAQHYYSIHRTSPSGGRPSLFHNYQTKSRN